MKNSTKTGAYLRNSN